MRRGAENPVCRHPRRTAAAGKIACATAGGRVEGLRRTRNFDVTHPILGRRLILLDVRHAVCDATRMVGEDRSALGASGAKVFRSEKGRPGLRRKRWRAGNRPIAFGRMAAKKGLA